MATEAEYVLAPELEYYGHYQIRFQIIDDSILRLPIA